MSVSLKQACLDVANEIEAGTLVPGVESLYQNIDGMQGPCCSMGHVLWRLHAHGSGVFLEDIPHWGNVAEANDRKDWPEVISWLRIIANKVDGPSETLE